MNLDIKDTPDYIFQEVFPEWYTQGQLVSKIYDKRHKFNFQIVSFPFLIEYNHTYKVCI